MKRLLLMTVTVGLLAGGTPALAQSVTAPLTGNPRSAAGALARGTALANSLPLPSGIRWTTKVTRLTRPGDVQASQTIVVRREARGSRGVADLVQYFRTHTPAGMVLSTGEFGAADGLDEYATKAPTDTSAELEYGVGGGQVQLRLDVSVGWTPARPADTLLPSGLTGVTVEVWPPQYFGDTAVPNFGHQVIHATGPAVQPLTHYLNGLAVQGPFPFGGGACSSPLFYGSNPRFTFHTPHHVVVFQYVAQCQVLNVSVDGKHRPALSPSRLPVDPTRLVMTSLLHLVP